MTEVFANAHRWLHAAGASHENVVLEKASKQRFTHCLKLVVCVPLYIESPCACRYVHRICETKRAKLRINSGDNEQSVG